MYSLAGDIGGTWARLAVIDATGAICARHRMPVDDFTDPAGACAAFLDATGYKVDGVALAGAGPRSAEKVRLTNAAVLLDPKAIGKATQTQNVMLLNDVEAAAWGLKAEVLTTADIIRRGPDPLDIRHIVLISLGTGLGVAQRLFDPPAVLCGEGGHARLLPDNHEDAEIFESLRLCNPEMAVGNGLALEAEAVLGGTGLTRLFAALGGTSGKTPFQIVSAARNGEPVAAEALRRFGGFLGGFAGDLSLLAGERGCIVFTGGFLEAVPEVLGADFRKSFGEGGRCSGMRNACPILHLRDADLGLRGAWRALITGAR